MNFIRKETGYTGIDISISIVIIFIFVSLIATLIYNFNSSGKEIELRTEATNIAINEIEQVKIDGFEKYIGRSKANGNNVVVNSAKTDVDGFFKTITVLDYTDLPGNKEETPDIVKKVTVKISYMFKTKEQSVELSTILSKES